MTITFLIIIGLCLGSFVNALVYRVHQQTKKTNQRDNKYSILQGRSLCPHCKHQLNWKDLIPVFSWLSLGGKCRYCKKPISAQYPLVELLTAALFVTSYSYWPETLATDNWQLATFTLWLIILTGLMALLVYDLKWMILPNRILFPLFIPAGLFAIISIIGSDNAINSAFYCTISTILGGGIFWVLFQVSSGKWIGGGDVKLGFLLGLILGTPQKTLAMIMIASLIGTAIAIPLLLLKKVNASSKLAFGPMLIVATIIVQLLGQPIFDWYVNLVL